ncbi:phospho-sugar mutase [Streptomyces caniscabiei]|uniref:phospho-sugar mutase n=1 Tax=Streptomyces caniscabiei TaxID=2746961 RepID=UPI0029AE5E2F|nr:phospho-sugar mutase [Streptomyces caniscabiei]MDX2775894.1 phospho-sugar mutase [Streptomyces caniscabiei]
MPLTETLSQHLSEAATKNVQTWLNEPKYAEYRDDLVEMIEQERWQELEDAFFKVIEFGTGGRRGTTGVGSNRINRVTIGESAQALCEYAKSFDSDAPNKGVVIAYDTRLTSPELSNYTAQVCAAAGFKTYLFDSFRSTPELSFAVRDLGAAIGIVISASHNPPADNGFKAYWSDGGQLVAPHDKGVLEVAARIDAINAVDFEAALAEGKIEYVDKSVDERYIAAVVAQSEGDERDVKIVYSPLHGAGQTNVLPALRQAGFTDISLVEGQMNPDGNFPTIDSGKANPEEPGANDWAVAQMLAERADIAITNDPDADRIGVMVRTGDEAVYLNGNQSAVLATEYTLRKMRERGELTPKHYIAKTIVTTKMLSALAEKYGVTMYTNMLIGFKYIGELILKKETTDEIFVIGGEESYGLLKGDYARDKDGATGALPLAEYAAELKKEGKTLYDRMLELYVEHGLYLERLDSAYFLGASGFETMQTVMVELRKTPPTMIDQHVVTAILDYQTLERRDLKTGAVTPIDCISGNVVTLELDGDERRQITIRPSGTEPKLKFYVQWHEDVTDAASLRDNYAQTEGHLKALSQTLEGMLLR